MQYNSYCKRISYTEVGPETCGPLLLNVLNVLYSNLMFFTWYSVSRLKRLKSFISDWPISIGTSVDPVEALEFARNVGVTVSLYDLSIAKLAQACDPYMNFGEKKRIRTSGMAHL